MFQFSSLIMQNTDPVLCLRGQMANEDRTGCIGKKQFSTIINLLHLIEKSMCSPISESLYEAVSHYCCLCYKTLDF